MPKEYSEAPDEAQDRLKKVIRLFHPELKDIGLRVDLISVTTDSEEAPALSHQGYPAAAVVRVLGPKERTMGRGDAEIVIDEEVYGTMNAAARDALLDHELYHIKLKKNDHGVVKRDENGRPKIGLRKHDYQFGWFREIAKRHGDNSGEVQQARAMFTAERQTFFAFVTEQKTLTATPDSDVVEMARP